MKVNRINLTVYVRADETQEFLQDFADFRNGAEMAIYFVDSDISKVKTASLTEEQRDLFSYPGEDE